jgi:hypothetical protein
MKTYTIETEIRFDFTYEYTCDSEEDPWLTEPDERTAEVMQAFGQGRAALKPVVTVIDIQESPANGKLLAFPPSEKLSSENGAD